MHQFWINFYAFLTAPESHDEHRNIWNILFGDFWGRLLGLLLLFGLVITALAKGIYQALTGRNGKRG